MLLLIKLAVHHYPSSIAPGGHCPFQLRQPLIGVGVESAPSDTIVAGSAQLCVANEARSIVGHDPEHKESPIGKAVELAVMLNDLECLAASP